MEPNPSEVSQSTPTSTPPPVVNPENKPKKSHKALFFLLGMLIVLILVGGIGGGYYFGRSSITKELNSSTATIPPKDPEVYKGSPTPEAMINKAADWKIYSNPTMQISMEIPIYYEVISETPNKVIIGFKREWDEKLVPYLTINKNTETPYQSYKLCGSSINAFPCRDNEITTTKISGKNVDLVRINGGADILNEFIILTDTNTSSAKEINMDVAGGGLNEVFDHIKSTLKYN